MTSCAYADANAQHAGRGFRDGEARHPGPDYHRGMSLTTGNGTGWGTILEWIGSHRGEIICAQEHKVLSEDIPYERHRAMAKGWKTLWSPAVPSGTEANRPSGGTVIMARKHIGMAVPPGGEVVIEGHVCAAMIETNGMGWLAVYSVYGYCGEELGGRNWRICCAIADHAIGHGLPWIAAGDWNFEPAAMRASGWPNKMGAEVLCAPVTATTHAGCRQGRHIDYFLASRAVAALGPQMTLCAEAAIRTHDAIRMRFPEAPRSYVIRRLVRPKVFPRELPIGPREQRATPNDVIACARAARATSSKGDVGAAAILIDEATEAVLTHIENVLVDAYMVDECDRHQYLGRANGVKYAMGPLLGPKTGIHGSSPPTIRRMRSVQDKANALAAAILRCADRERDQRGCTGTDTRGWMDVVERSKAAIHAGHHAAMASDTNKGAADVVCEAYANELKQLGKQTEKYFEQRHYAERPLDCGWCHGTAPHEEWLGYFSSWASDIAKRAAEAAEPCEAIHRNERASAIREWAHHASHAGAAMAHRWTKVPVEWRPETVEADIGEGTVVTADPGAVVEAERDKWDKYWNPHEEMGSELDWGHVDELERPTALQFRRAARSFPRTTGVGVEGITPADFDALDDYGIEACIDVMMSCEAAGYIPRAIALILVRMIPKKDGGRRPIGLLPSLYRIWAKVRGNEVRNWERKWERRYFAAGPGKSAEGAAWGAALRAEIAAAANADSASVLWDLLKCFEHGKHDLLATEARRMGFPLAIARMSVAMYRAERRLVVDDALSEAIHPTRGFMAGCARALALVKVVMIRRIDAFVARHPRITLDLYVDDVELQAVGTLRIVGDMAAAVKDLRCVLCEDLGFPLAEDKSQVVASKKEIADEIVAATDGTAGSVAVQAVKLGVEMTAGKRRGARGGHKRARFNKALARQRRLMRFKKLGGAAVKVARRGVIPSATFGKKVCGVSDAELRQLRKLVAQTLAPCTKGTSQALKLLLDGDPAREANASTIVEWATAAWACAAGASGGDGAYTGGESNAAGADGAQRSEPVAAAAGAYVAPRCRAADAYEAQRLSDEYASESPAVGASVAPRCDSDSVPYSVTADDRFNIGATQLHAAVRFAVEDTREGSWERVRGPASATVLTARRLGWRFRDGTTVINEYGDDIDMAKVAPQSVRSAVIRATDKCTTAEAAERWGRREFAHGIWVRPVRTALGKLQPAARAALRRAWCGGYWSRAKLADCALASCAECEHCGAPRDDAFHRIWECDRTEEKREAMTTPSMRSRAAEAGRDDWEFTRGLVPNPWMIAPRPREDYEEVHVGSNMEVLDQPLLVDQPVFVDGSAYWPTNPDARRAGWSIVMIDGCGKLRGAIFGHLPWPESNEQTAGHAEMYALRRAAELAVGGLRAYTDYKEAAEGTAKGKAATTGPKAKHAAHWRAFWTAVEGEDFEVIKVKGHVTEEEVRNDHDLQWRRRGNALADRFAKKGAKMHYSEVHWTEALRTDKTQEAHVQLCQWIGTALGEWHYERQCRRRKPDREAMMAKRRKRREKARLVGGHRLQWDRDGWQCKYCGTRAKTASGAQRTLDHPCPGQTAARIPREADSGAAAHVLWTAEADSSQRQSGADVTWCGVCGAYSSAKVYKLKGLCTGPAEGAALTRLRSLQRLRHPVLGYRLKTPHRTTDEFMDAMTERGDERRRKYEEAMRVGTGDCMQSGDAEPTGDPDPRPELDVHGADSGPHAEPSRHTAGNNDEMDECYDECLVFGHGGGLDETQEVHTGYVETDTNAAAPRLVPSGHRAGSSVGMRTVPDWLVAAQNTVTNNAVGYECDEDKDERDAMIGADLTVRHNVCTDHGEVTMDGLVHDCDPADGRGGMPSVSAEADAEIPNCGKADIDVCRESDGSAHVLSDEKGRACAPIAIGPGDDYDAAAGRYGNCPGSSTDGSAPLKRVSEDKIDCAERHRLAAARIAAVRMRVLARCNAVGAANVDGIVDRTLHGDAAAQVVVPASQAVHLVHAASGDDGLRAVPMRHDSSLPMDAVDEDGTSYGGDGTDEERNAREVRVAHDRLAKRRRLRGKGPPSRPAAYPLSYEDGVALAEAAGKSATKTCSGDLHRRPAEQPCGEVAARMADSGTRSSFEEATDSDRGHQMMRLARHAWDRAEHGSDTKRRRLRGKGPAMRDGGEPPVTDVMNDTSAG